MGILDSVRGLLTGAADAGRLPNRPGRRPAAPRERGTPAGLSRTGAKFRVFSTELSGAIAELDRALVAGDPAVVRAGLPGVIHAIDRMEEYLDLAGGELVDLLSLELPRVAAFSAVATHGAGLSLCKEASTAAVAGDLAAAGERLAAGTALLAAFPDGIVARLAR